MHFTKFTLMQVPGSSHKISIYFPTQSWQPLRVCELSLERNIWSWGNVPASVVLSFDWDVSKQDRICVRSVKFVTGSLNASALVVLLDSFWVRQVLKRKFPELSTNKYQLLLHAIYQREHKGEKTIFRVSVNLIDKTNASKWIFSNVILKSLAPPRSSQEPDVLSKLIRA